MKCEYSTQICDKLLLTARTPQNLESLKKYFSLEINIFV